MCSFWRYRNPRIGLQSLWWLLFFLQRNSLQFADLAQLVNSVRRGPACCSTLTTRLFCFFPFHSEFTVCLQDRLFYQDDITERLIQLLKRKKKKKKTIYLMYKPGEATVQMWRNSQCIWEWVQTVQFPLGSNGTLHDFYKK